MAGDTVRVLEIINALRSLGSNVTPIIPDDGPRELLDRFYPYETFRIPWHRNIFMKYLLRSLTSQYLLPANVLNLDFDIIQMECAYALPFSKLRRIAHRNRIVFDMHSIVARDLAPYIPRPIRPFVSMLVNNSQNYLIKASDCIVVSNSMKKAILSKLKIDPQRIHVIPNGVNLELAKRAIHNRKHKFEHLRDGTDLLLVYVGGLEWYEGVDTLIDAVALIRDRIKDIRLLIAGRGREEISLRKQVKGLNLDNNVGFIGWLSYEDTFAVQSMADILVAPRKPLGEGSQDFSTPMKIPSYLTAGKPIVSSYLGEIPYVARDGQEAILVKNLVPLEFCNAILRIAEDQLIAKQLSANSLSRAEQFSWISISDKLIKIYTSIINGTR